ncbi:MAG: flagellar basal-body rod protein FlgG [bacterium]|nr:flagellar basal-body rod protein FlgG [bacterium]
MIRALRTAASGMFAEQLKIDTVANNLSNVNTSGYKKQTVQFQDLIYQSTHTAAAGQGDGTLAPVPIAVGHGVRPISTDRIFTQGSPTETNNPLDVMVEGTGFFQVTRADGRIAYTRDGTFKLSSDGTVVTSGGYRLEPELRIPEDATSIVIGRDGAIAVTTLSSAQTETVGQLELAKFVNPAGLNPLGQNLFEETSSSGMPTVANPGQEGIGEVVQGYYEASNVAVVEEMVAMILAQRAYEANSKSIITADSMLQVVNSLKR